MPVKRRTTPDPNELQIIGESFVETDDNAKMFGAAASELKKKLMDVLEKFGDPDEDGHQWMTLPAPVESRTTASNGKRREETVTGFQRQKRKSRYIDAEKAEAWAKKHKVWDQVSEEVTTREVVEDALWRLVFEKQFTEDEINDLYGENVTFALVRVTE
jgi:hypothetical protein